MQYVFLLWKFWILNTFFLSLAISSPNATPLPFQLQPAQTIQHESITEASGMAYSIQNPQCIWIINDGGNSNQIFAIHPNGKHLKTFQLQQAPNRDWEDLALFQHQNISYLLIADSGNNKAVNQTQHLYLLPEPDLKKYASIPTPSLFPQCQISYQYDDKGSDCEAVAVDPISKKIFLISKGKDPNIIYELPLVFQTPDKTLTAKTFATLPPLSSSPTKNPSPFHQLIRKSLEPTSFDISQNGKKALLLTYTSAYEFQRHANESWSQTFQKKPTSLPLFFLPQAEAICYGKNTDQIFIASEGKNAPLIQFLKVETIQ